MIGLAVLVVGLGVAAWFWIQRDTSRPVTLDEARDRRNETNGGLAPDPSGSDEPGSDGPVRPAAGVYEYEGTGTESLSLPPLSQSQGPTVPATVEHLGNDCWSIRFDYSNNHWQKWNYCPLGADLVETGGESWQRWMIGATAITNLTTATCDDAMVLPASRTPGQVWEASCTATNEAVDGEATSAGDYTFVGDEDIEVGGHSVPTAHFVREREMSGAQEGSERSEVWFAVDTGLPIRNERTISVSTDTPVGASTYEEDGSFRLVGPDPVD